MHEVHEISDSDCISEWCVVHVSAQLDEFFDTVVTVEASANLHLLHHLGHLGGVLTKRVVESLSNYVPANCVVQQ